MTDTETKLHDAVTQFDLAANTDDEAMVRSCVNKMIGWAQRHACHAKGIGTVPTE